MSSDDLDLDYNNNINNLVRAARSRPSHDELTNAKRPLCRRRSIIHCLIVRGIRGCGVHTVRIQSERKKRL